jgi:ABC-type sugar transport system ATPase subunit
VIISARPEDMSIHFQPQPDAVEFKVYAIQPTGPEMFVQLKRGNRTVVVRETRQVDLKMDQSVWLSIELSQVNFYDEKSGRMLAREEKT